MSWAHTDLGQTAERLRRLLNLAGHDPVNYQDPSLVPVIIAGDATGVGYSANKGRRWVWSIETGFAAASTVNMFVVARVPLTVDSIFLQAYTTGTTTNDPTRFAMSQSGWADAAPGVPTSGAGAHYAEGISLASEVGPIVFGSGAGAYSGGAEFSRGMTTSGYTDPRGILSLESRPEINSFAYLGVTLFTVNAVGVYWSLGGRLL